MVTRAKRASNNKWDAENMIVLGCKVRKEKADAFRAACKEKNTTPNAVFIQAIDNLLRETDKGAQL